MTVESRVPVVRKKGHIVMTSVINEPAIEPINDQNRLVRHVALTDTEATPVGSVTGDHRPVAMTMTMIKTVLTMTDVQDETRDQDAPDGNTVHHRTTTKTVRTKTTLLRTMTEKEQKVEML